MSAKDWAGIEIPGMYAVAKVGEDPDSWRQVTAWYDTLELLNFHEEQLRMARDELAEMWPPGRSPAATAFVKYVDDLLSDINRAQDDASANHRALAMLLQSLAHAKADMATLAAKYDRYEEEQRNRNLNPVNYAEHSGGSGWREELNRRGRERMGRADQEVFEASRQMAIPRVARRPSHSPATNTLHDRGGSSTVSETTPRYNPTSFPYAVVPTPSEVDAALQAQHPDLAPVTDGSPSELAGSPSAGTLPPPTMAPNYPIGGPPPQPSWSPLPGGPIRANPPGGVIGAPRGTTPTQHSALPPSGAPGSRAGGPPPAGVRRVSPVGGVIGETRPPGSSTPATGPSRGARAVGGAPHSGNANTPMTPGVARGGRRREDADRPGDPEAYRLWPVAEGVPPVIEARPEPFHDPGPGVIGIDR